MKAISSKDRQHIDQLVKENKLVLISDNEIKAFPDITELLNTNYEFVYLNQLEDYVKKLEQILKEAQKKEEKKTGKEEMIKEEMIKEEIKIKEEKSLLIKNEELKAEKEQIKDNILKYGFAISFEAIETEKKVFEYKYVTEKLLIHLLGPRDNKGIDSSTLFLYKDLSSNSPLNILIHLASQKINTKELQIKINLMTEAERNSLIFLNNYDSYGLYQMTFEIYLYTNLFLLIPEEKKYFCLFSENSYHIVYSKKGFFYNFENDIFHEMDAEAGIITIIPWLFKEQPSSKLQKQFHAFNSLASN